MEVDINTSKRNMSEINETGSSSRRNPLLWISLVIVGLILFVLLKGERGDLVSGNIDADLNSYEIESTDQATETDDSASTIEQNELLLPGKRARQYIERVREVGKPYPLEIVFEKAQAFRQEGNLADAHLLLFFAARENYSAGHDGDGGDVRSDTLSGGRIPVGQCRCRAGIQVVPKGCEPGIPTC